MARLQPADGTPVGQGGQLCRSRRLNLRSAQVLLIGQLAQQRGGRQCSIYLLSIEEQRLLGVEHLAAAIEPATLLPTGAAQYCSRGFDAFEPDLGLGSGEVKTEHVLEHRGVGFEAVESLAGKLHHGLG